MEDEVSKLGRGWVIAGGEALGWDTSSLHASEHPIIRKALGVSDE